MAYTHFYRTVNGETRHSLAAVCENVFSLHRTPSTSGEELYSHVCKSLDFLHPLCTNEDELTARCKQDIIRTLHIFIIVLADFSQEVVIVFILQLKKPP